MPKINRNGLSTMASKFSENNRFSPLWDLDDESISDSEIDEIDSEPESEHESVNSCNRILFANFNKISKNNENSTSENSPTSVNPSKNEQPKTDETFQFVVCFSTRARDGSVTTSSYPIDVEGESAAKANKYYATLIQEIEEKQSGSKIDVIDYQKGIAIVKSGNDKITVSLEEMSALQELRKIIKKASDKALASPIVWPKIVEPARGSLLAEPNLSQKIFPKSHIPSTKEAALNDLFILKGLDSSKRDKINFLESFAKKELAKLMATKNELSDKIGNNACPRDELEKLHKEAAAIEKQISQYKNIDWFAISYAIAYPGTDLKDINQRTRSLCNHLEDLKIQKEKKDSLIHGAIREKDAQTWTGKIKKSLFREEPKLSDEEKGYAEDIVLMPFLGRLEYLRACHELGVGEKADAIENTLVQLGISVDLMAEDPVEKKSISSPENDAKTAMLFGGLSLPGAPDLSKLTNSERVAAIKAWLEEDSRNAKLAAERIQDGRFRTLKEDKSKEEFLLKELGLSPKGVMIKAAAPNLFDGMVIKDSKNLEAITRFNNHPLFRHRAF